MAQYKDITSSWWNHDKYPVITLGPIAFPAPVLPILVSFAFVFYKTYPGHENRHGGNARGQQAPEIADRQAEPAPRGNIVDNLPPDVPELERYTGNALSFVHSLVMRRTMTRPNSRQYAAMADKTKLEFHTPNVQELQYLCIVEAAALAIGVYFFRRSASKVQGVLAAVGFLCFAYGRTDEVADFCLVALLALPSAMQILGRPSARESMAGSLLLVLACNEFLPDDSPVRSYKSKAFELWRPGLMLTCAMLAEISRKLREPLPANTSRLGVAWQTFLEGNREMVKGVSRVVIIVGSIYLSFMGAGYLSGCLPWRPFFWGVPAQPPGRKEWIAVQGIIFHIPPYAILSYMGKHYPGRRPYQMSLLEHALLEVRFCTLITGWAVTGSMAAYIVLRIVYG